MPYKFRAWRWRRQIHKSKKDYVCQSCNQVSSARIKQLEKLCSLLMKDRTRLEKEIRDINEYLESIADG